MALPDSLLRVEVVSADGVIWEGEAESVIARTTEGDIGILPNHEPLLAVLVPSAAEVLSSEGNREIVALDGGFLSVAGNRVAILSGYAKMAQEITLADAEVELAEATKNLEAGHNDETTKHHFDRATAQVKAAHRMAGRH
ncbi:F0F1 ATP synthase subunit epsilon [Propioniciclava soli]|uniref:ATP synthase epsilon chain n=1 Tax=Propioniciclava soli TaxID=2775081 RepID=A0ABZ3C2P4_9ACTN|nr:F0F1 ATP synthase subunit epsilon [Propioniciclava soli]